MKTEKPTPNVDDIELHPDAWERFLRAVKSIGPRRPVDHPTGHGKQQSRPRSATVPQSQSTGPNAKERHAGKGRAHKEKAGH